MAKNTEEKILYTLEQILKVLSLQVGSDKSLTERVVLLKSIGLDNKTIALILRTTELSVRVLASQSKSKNNR